MSERKARIAGPFFIFKTRQEETLWRSNRPRLFLLDAYALIYRAYYAFIRNPITNSKGVNTSAAYGFTATFERFD